MWKIFDTAPTSDYHTPTFNRKSAATIKWLFLYLKQGKIMEIKEFSAVQLALNACVGITTLAAKAQSDLTAKDKLLSSLESVNEVLTKLSKSERNAQADMAYTMLYDAYHRTLNAVNGNFVPETKN